MRRIVIDGWHLGAAAGLGSFSERLARGLAERAAAADWVVEVVVPSQRFRQANSTLPLAHLVSVGSPRVQHPLLDEYLWKNRIGLWCRRHRPDAVLLSPAPFWSVRAPRQTVVVHHDCINRHFVRYQGKWLVRRWLAQRTEKFLSRCSLVITESHHAGEELIRLVGVSRDRVKVIPAWLPPQYAASAAHPEAARVRSRYGLPDRYWLYVGGYDYRKNIELLIAAYATARTRAPCPTLVLAGKVPGTKGGPVCDVWGALTRNGLETAAVRLPGFVAAADMPGLYAGAELLVYPSLYEGFGLPPLEAMGCGCPALVADNSSLPEVVADPEYRFDTRDASTLVALLEKAALRPLPLNPSFSAATFGERAAMDRYVAAIKPLMA